MLAEQMEYWGPGTFQQQLDHAYDDFVRYCRRNKLGHSQPPFKVSKVVWRSSFIFLKHIFLTVWPKRFHWNLWRTHTQRNISIQVVLFSLVLTLDFGPPSSGQTTHRRDPTQCKSLEWAYHMPMASWHDAFGSKGLWPDVWPGAINISVSIIAPHLILTFATCIFYLFSCVSGMPQQSMNFVDPTISSVDGYDL